MKKEFIVKEEELELEKEATLAVNMQLKVVSLKNS